MRPMVGQHREVAIFPSSARLAGSSVAFLPPRRCGGRHAPAREAAGPPSPGTQHNRQWSGDDGQVPVSVRLPIPAMDDPWCCSLLLVGCPGFDQPESLRPSGRGDVPVAKRALQSMPVTKEARFILGQVLQMLQPSPSVRN
jgi:hypothetical protein